MLADDAYRTPLPAQSSTYELLQLQPGPPQPGVTNLFGFDELQTASATGRSDGAHDIPYENLNPAGPECGRAYRRLLERTRTYYRPDDMGAAAGDPRALLAAWKARVPGAAGNQLQARFYAGTDLAGLPARRNRTAAAPAGVLGSVAADGGGYVDLDGDGHWWIPSGRGSSSCRTAPASPQEKNRGARSISSCRAASRIPSATPRSVDYDDPHDLLVVQDHGRR